MNNNKIIIAFFVLIFCGQNNIVAMEEGSGSKALCEQLFGKNFTKKKSLTHKTAKSALALEKAAQVLTSDSCEQFFSSDLTKFDPTVGDNLCQVRAQHLSLLANDSAFTSGLKDVGKKCSEAQEKTAITLGKVKAIIEEKKKKEVQGLNGKLKKGLFVFLTDKKVDTPQLTLNDKMVVCSHVLSQYYSDDSKKRSSLLKSLIQKTGLSKGTANNSVLRPMKTLLNSVTNTCLDLKSARLGMGLYTQQKEQKRPFSSASTFGGLKVLLKDSKEKGLPIVLKSNIACADHGAHVVCIPKLHSSKLGSKTGCMVIEGISDPDTILDSSLSTITLEDQLKQKKASTNDCVKVIDITKELSDTSLDDIVLPNTAMHHAFVDKDAKMDFTVFGEQEGAVEAEFNKYKNNGMSNGFCKENMGTFGITHVFADNGKKYKTIK
jgi:hypothetical protein